MAASARVVARMLHSQYVSSFDRWQEFAEQWRRLRKVSRRLLNMRASMALSAWVEAVDMWQTERAD